MCDELAPSLCSEVYRPFLSLSCKSILCDQFDTWAVSRPIVS